VTGRCSIYSYQSGTASASPMVQAPVITEPFDVNQSLMTAPTPGGQWISHSISTSPLSMLVMYLSNECNGGARATRTFLCPGRKPSVAATFAHSSRFDLTGTSYRHGVAVERGPFSRQYAALSYPVLIGVILTMVTRRWRVVDFVRSRFAYVSPAASANGEVQLLLKHCWAPNLTLYKTGQRHKEHLSGSFRFKCDQKIYLRPL